MERGGEREKRRPLSTILSVRVVVVDVNEPPIATFDGQVSSVLENSGAGTHVAYLDAEDKDEGSTMTFSLVSATANLAAAYGYYTGSPSSSAAVVVAAASTATPSFAVSSDGEVTVAKGAVLDFEGVTSYTLQVRVVDGGIADGGRTGVGMGSGLTSDEDTSRLSVVGTLTINVANVNGRPSFREYGKVLTAVDIVTRAVDEDAAPGDRVGAPLNATDPDASTQFTFAIESVGGLASNAQSFVIDSCTGQITMGPDAALNYETTATYKLVDSDSDNGRPRYTSLATVEILVNNVDEAPTFDAAKYVFAVDENLATGAAVGTMKAADPEKSSSVVYAIDPRLATAATAAAAAFAIDKDTDMITVKDDGMLDFETHPEPFSFPVLAADDDTSLRLALAGGGGAAVATVEISLNDVNEAPEVTTSEVSVAENSKAGTITDPPVLEAFDVDEGQTFTYKLVGGDAGATALLDLNAATGMLTVATGATLNKEAAGSYRLEVMVTDDHATTPLSSTADVTVTIDDVNEPPVITATAAFTASFVISENVAEGTLVGAPLASVTVDPEVAAGAQTLAYSIVTGNSGGAFRIDPSTGQVSVSEATLDHEADAEHVLVLSVADSDGDPLSDSTTVTITVTNVNEAPTTEGRFELSIDENAPAATNAGLPLTYFDVDNTFTNADTATWSLDAVQPTDGPMVTNGLAMFEITAAGNVTVRSGAVVDYETTPQLLLRARVTDGGGLSATTLVIVNANDMNEAPVFDNGLTRVLVVADDAAQGLSFGKPVVAMDVDENQDLSYDVSYINASRGTATPFSINPVTGQLRVGGFAGSSDAATLVANAVHTLTVHATDDGADSLTAKTSVEVRIVAGNKQPLCQDLKASTAENPPAGGVYVAQVVCSDPNAEDVLSYEIMAGNHNEAFRIDKMTGKVHVNGHLNFEKRRSYSLTVVAVDNAKNPMAGACQVAISIEDRNERPWLPATNVFRVDENRAG